MSSSMRLVSERLPGVGERAAALYERDETFHDLCDDYEACAHAVSRLERPNGGNEGLRAEYAALQLRLERELLRYVEEHPGV